MITVNNFLRFLTFSRGDMSLPCPPHMGALGDIGVGTSLVGTAGVLRRL